LGLLLAALFLIGAGFGAAETVYQFVQEREGAPAELPVRTPTPRPSAADMDLGALAPSLVKAERLTLTRLDDPPRYVFNVAVDFPCPGGQCQGRAARVACGASVPASARGRAVPGGGRLPGRASEGQYRRRHVPGRA
jgi:hypothetical protein